MSEGFESDFFRRNRKELKKLFVGTAPIVLTANGRLQRSADESFNFVQDNNFWYLTGLDLPDLILVMDKDKEYLILPARSHGQAVMEGDLDVESIIHLSGIKDVMHHKSGWKQLGSRLKRAKHIATLPAAPTYIEHYGFYANPARASLIKKIKQVSPDIAFLNLGSHLAKLRVVKQPEELIVLQSAIDITAATLNKIHRRLASYSNEKQIETDLIYEFSKRGAADQAFGAVVASAANATVPHYRANNSPLKKRSLITLDVGAKVGGYAADITRTFALGTPTKRQRDVYEAVAEVQAFGFDNLYPGLSIRDFETKIEHYMGEKLRELNLIKNIDNESVRRYYPHMTSHFLGLDVHDVGDYEAPLATNMVVTVEPGIYISEESIGVRIEDDVLITNKGIKILSRRAKKAL